MDLTVGDLATVARIAAALALAALPLAWLRHQRWAAPHRSPDGTDEDLPMLGALLFAGFALALAGVATLRLGWEYHERAEWRPLTAVVDACAVQEMRAGALGGGRVYELSCTVHYAMGGVAYSRTVAAGHPTSRDGYDRWVAAHPAGAHVSLRYPPGDPMSPYGLADAVRGATTARDSAARALLFGGIAGALFAVSRVRARRRERWLEDW